MEKNYVIRFHCLFGAFLTDRDIKKEQLILMKELNQASIGSSENPNEN